jgi:hypothetical protein
MWVHKPVPFPNGAQQLALCGKKLPPPKELMYVFVINFSICTYYLY